MALFRQYARYGFSNDPLAIAKTESATRDSTHQVIPTDVRTMNTHQEVSVRSRGENGALGQERMCGAVDNHASGKCEDNRHQDGNKFKHG